MKIVDKHRSPVLNKLAQALDGTLHRHERTSNARAIILEAETNGKVSSRFVLGETRRTQNNYTYLGFVSENRAQSEIIFAPVKITEKPSYGSIEWALNQFMEQMQTNRPIGGLYTFSNTRNPSLHNLYAIIEGFRAATPKAQDIRPSISYRPKEKPSEDDTQTELF